jgi:diphthamide synthase (EF-2-diphthine--ammonia ligase)
MAPDLDALHTAALARGEHRYRDPASGHGVFTALGLEARGECCGAGCRHCPYAHAWVPDVLRGELVQDPWIEGVEPGAEPVDVLSWSGGKGSLLALCMLARESARDVVLLTSFDGRSHRVAHQGVGLDDIRAQVERLGIGLVGVPLYPERDHGARIGLALQRLAARRPLSRLVFGDLHLRHVRASRGGRTGRVAAAAGASLHFPLRDVPYAELEARLWASGAVATVSAVVDPALQTRVAMGDVVSARWMDALPGGVDRMGAHGGYHTLVVPPPGGWRALGG